MLNCVIIDDEPLAREGLIDFVGEVDFLRLTGTCEDPVQLIHFLEQHSVDLLFLDIQMPKMTGIDLLKIARNPPMAILTTAFSEYAVESYRLNVIDYLVKPITFDRFLQAAGKARDYHRFQTSTQKEEMDHFFVKCTNQYEKIFFADILYLESKQNYIVIHTEKAKFMTLLNLKTLEQQFDHRAFVRVHKSYMVAVSKIDSVDSSEVRIGAIHIPIGRSYKEAIMERVVNKRLIN